MTLLNRSIKCLIPIVAVVLISCKDNKEQHAQAFIDSASEYIQKSEYPSAVIQLNNALRIEPGNLAALKSLAIAFEAERDWYKLQSVLLKIVQLYPNQVEAKLKLSQLHLARGSTQKAQELISQLLAQNQNNHLAWVMQAKIYLAQNSMDLALSSLDKALAITPGNRESILTLTQIYLADGDADKALDILNQGQKINASEPDFYIYRAKILASSGQVAQAKAIIQALIEQNPNNIGYHKILANLYLTNGEPDEALTVFSKFAEAHPTEDTILQLAYMTQTIKGTQGALTTLNTYSTKYPEFTDLRLHAAALLMKDGKLQQARAELSAFLTKIDNQALTIKAKNQLALIDLALNKPQSVADLTDEILALDPANLTATLTKAKLEISQRNSDLAIRQLRGALNQHGDIADIHFLLAKAHRLKGETPVAQMHYQEAINLSDFKTDFVLESAQFMLSLNKLKPAEGLLLKTNKLHPKDTQVLELLTRVRLMNKDWEQAEATIMKLQTLDAESGKPDLLMGYALAGSNEYEKSAEAFKQTLTKDGDTFPAIIGYTQALVKAGQPEVALRFIESLANKYPERAELKLQKFKLLLETGATDHAEAMISSLLKEYPNNVNVSFVLANYYLSQNNLNEATSILETGVANNENSFDLRFKLAQLYEEQNNIEHAIAQYRNIITSNGPTPIANNNLAALVMNYGVKAEFPKLQPIIAPLEATSVPEFLDTVGWYYYNLGEPKKALTSIEESYLHLSTNPEVNFHLGMVYKALGSNEQAKKHLEFSTSLPQSKTFNFYADAIAALEQL